MSGFSDSTRTATRSSRALEDQRAERGCREIYERAIELCERAVRGFDRRAPNASRWIEPAGPR